MSGNPSGDIGLHLLFEAWKLWAEQQQELWRQYFKTEEQHEARYQYRCWQVEKARKQLSEDEACKARVARREEERRELAQLRPAMWDRIFKDMEKKYGPMSDAEKQRIREDVEAHSAKMQQESDEWNRKWFPKTWEPLVLDLDGNSVIRTLSAGDGVYFDFNASGLAEKSGWVGPGEGLLCMDRNGNGTIDDGSELFGDQTLLPNGETAADGFQALAALDGNHDGKIDAQDPAYSQLAVWVDYSNPDGICSQPGELHTLPQLGIAAISLNSTTVNITDSEGNIEYSVGSFQKADGTTGLIAEYFFQTEPFNTMPTEYLPVPDEIAALPDLAGGGNVYSLWQAMVRDTSGGLEALVKQFAAEDDPNVRTGLMDQILFQWTGSENMDPNSRGGSIDARKLAVLEAFMGEQWSSTVASQGNYSNPNPGASVMLDGLYHDISAGVYGMLMAQTHFKDLFGMITYTTDPNTQAKMIDPDSMTAMFNQLDIEVANDPVNGQQLLSEFDRTLLGISEYHGGGSGSGSWGESESGSGYTGAGSGGEALSAAAMSAGPVSASLAEGESGGSWGDGWGGGSGGGWGGGSGGLGGRCGPPPPPGNPGPGNRRDPLVLDVTGFGIQTTSIGSPGQGCTYFDHNGNGYAVQTGWISPWDGFLVMDRNGNGTIDDGSELFSEYTLLSNGQRAHNGYEALGDLDANDDYKIDANDPVYSKLMVWQDVNGDGISDPWELHTLSYYGIASINAPASFPAAPNTTNPDAQGNYLQVSGTYTKADGTSGQMGLYSFVTNPTYSVQEQWITVPDNIAQLPDLQGYGTLSTLHQSMAQDSSGQLESLVEQYVNSADSIQWSRQAEQVLCEWAGAYDTVGVPQNLRASIPGCLDAYSYGVAVSKGLVGSDSAPYGNMTEVEWNRALAYRQSLITAVLNKFYPHDGYALPVVQGTSVLSPTETYRQIFELTYAELMAQTHLKGLYDKITYTWDEVNQQAKTDFTAVIPDILAALNSDPEQGRQLLSEFARTLRGISSCSAGCYLAFREHMLEIDASLGWVFDSGGLPTYEHVGQGIRTWSPHIEGTDNADAIRGSLTEGDGYLNGLNGDDVIYGTDRDEVLINENGDALLVGGGGNDTIHAGAGNDILDGGSGADILYGETGNDTYIFRRGSGQDTIIDTDPTAGNIDTIWLGSNLTAQDITLKRSGDNLVLTIIGTSDVLTVKNFFKLESSLNRVERLQFMDGTVWTDSDMSLAAQSPTEGDDFIFGGTEADVISALGGNDRVYGREGDDTIHGDEGNDLLYGGAGADKLYGDAGDDMIKAGAGDDVLDGGAGNDTLYGGETGSASSTGHDTYLFGRGGGQDVIRGVNATPGTISLAEGILPESIALQLAGDDLKLTILDTLDTITVQSWVVDHTPGHAVGAIQFADGTVWATDQITAILLSNQTSEGDDYISGFSTADTIQGLGGRDTLRGGKGGDTLDGGSGSDYLIGEEGDDTLKGGADGDYLYGGTGSDLLDGGTGPDYLEGGMGIHRRARRARSLGLFATASAIPAVDDCALSA